MEETAAPHGTRWPTTQQTIQLKQARRDQLKATDAVKQVAGLVGTIDQRFIDSNVWRPRDFDFSVWNTARSDQQAVASSARQVDHG